MIDEARLGGWEREIQLHREVSHPDVVRKNKMQNVTVGDMEDLLAALKEANALFAVAHLEAKNALDRADRAEAQVRQVNTLRESAEQIYKARYDRLQKLETVREATEELRAINPIVGGAAGQAIWQGVCRALDACKRTGEGEHYG